MTDDQVQHHGNLLDGGRLVERDGKPWPPAQEPEPVAVEPATDDQIASLERMLSDPDARPRDGSGISWHSARALLARVRQEQATLLQTNEWLRDAERERDEAVDRAKAENVRADDERERAEAAERERDEAVARAEKAEALAGSLATDAAYHEHAAEKAEAALAGVERVTAAERAVVENARKWYLLPHEHDVDVELTELCAAVRALRDAQEADQ